MEVKSVRVLGGCLEHCMKGSGERWPWKAFRSREGGLKWMENVLGKQQPAEKITGQPRRRLSDFFWPNLSKGSWTVTGKFTLSQAKCQRAAIRKHAHQQSSWVLLSIFIWCLVLNRNLFSIFFVSLLACLLKNIFLIFLLSTILTASLKASLCPALLSVFPSSPVATLSLHWYDACPELFWVYLECIWQIFLLKSHLTHFSYYSHWFLFFSDIGFSSTLSFSLILFRFFTWHPITLSQVGFCPLEL